MTAFNSWKTLAAVVGLAATTAGCGDVVRQGRAPVFLVVDMLTGARGAVDNTDFTNNVLSDVLTMVTNPAPCTPTSPCPTIFNDLGKVKLSAPMKDITMAPSSNNSVTINRYHVKYRRADGRTQQGVDVPYEFDGAVTGTIPAGGSVELGFELVRHVAKKESPLVQLIANPNIIQTIADVTFFGRDLVGNDVAVTGSILIDFGNFGDF